VKSLKSFALLRLSPLLHSRVSNTTEVVIGTILADAATPNSRANPMDGEA